MGLTSEQDGEAADDGWLEVRREAKVLRSQATQRAKTPDQPDESSEGSARIIWTLCSRS